MRVAGLLLCALPRGAARTLVVYAYSQHTGDAVANIKFFLRFGVRPAPDVDYVFVVNGCHSIAFPKHLANVRVLERANTCFDFGAWGIGIEDAEARGERYDFVVVLNSSVRGPFLPKYERRDWWRVFTDDLDEAEVVGTSLHCMDFNASAPSASLLHLQSMVLAFRAETLAKSLKPYFQSCPADKATAIYDFELPASRAVLAAGGALRSQLLAVPGIVADADGSNRHLVDACEELRRNSALELGDVYFPAADAAAPDVTPLEVVFFKTARSLANRAALDRLTHWAYFHAADGALRDPAARRRDFALDSPRGEDCRDEAAVLSVGALPDDASRDRTDPTIARLKDLEAALRAANAEIAELRGDVARLRSTCVSV